ncbi:MAG: sulfatase [Verrucomicrobiales bacterium]|nr:sulfatase [Verrucomicrobiales bacterium]
MIRVLSIFLILLCLSCSGRERPNIVFILADDLGYGDLGCYGCTDIKTPHLDRLASEGVRFTDFYANGAVCSPTRVAFLTGRYQHRIGIFNALTYQQAGVGLPEEGATIADALKEAGYRTGLSGKWHVGYDFERCPIQQGFDHFFGLLGGNHHYFKHMDRIGVPDLWLGNEAVEREGYSTDLITEDAVKFLESNQKAPFFLYLSHAAPHFPWQGPGDEKKVVKPKSKSWQTGDRETYIAMVERMDHGIGRVLTKLDDLGLRENTLVVFTSDNGGHSWSRNAPLRDYKGTLWEGGIRVPCMARWSGVIPADTTSSQIGITMDWTATFRNLAGLPRDEAGADGIDLMPVLTGEKPVQERSLFWLHRKTPFRKSVIEGRAVRRGDWKLIEFADGKNHLFDLKTDPGETSDQYKSRLEMVLEMRQLLDKWEKEINHETGE